MDNNFITSFLSKCITCHLLIILGTNVMGQSEMSSMHPSSSSERMSEMVQMTSVAPPISDMLPTMMTPMPSISAMPPPMISEISLTQSMPHPMNSNIPPSMMTPPMPSSMNPPEISEMLTIPSKPPSMMTPMPPPMISEISPSQSMPHPINSNIPPSMMNPPIPSSMNPSEISEMLTIPSKPPSMITSMPFISPLHSPVLSEISPEQSMPPPMISETTSIPPLRLSMMSDIRSLSQVPSSIMSEMRSLPPLSPSVFSEMSSASPLPTPLMSEVRSLPSLASSLMSEMRSTPPLPSSMLSEMRSMSPTVMSELRLSMMSDIRSLSQVPSSIMSEMRSLPPLSPSMFSEMSSTPSLPPSMMSEMSSLPPSMLSEMRSMSPLLPSIMSIPSLVPSLMSEMRSFSHLSPSVMSPLSPSMFSEMSSQPKLPPSMMSEMSSLPPSMLSIMRSMSPLLPSIMSIPSLVPSLMSEMRSFPNSSPSVMSEVRSMSSLHPLPVISETVSVYPSSLSMMSEMTSLSQLPSSIMSEIMSSPPLQPQMSLTRSMPPAPPPVISDVRQMPSLAPPVASEIQPSPSAPPSFESSTRPVVTVPAPPIVSTDTGVRVLPATIAFKSIQGRAAISDDVNLRLLADIILIFRQGAMCKDWFLGIDNMNLSTNGETVTANLDFFILLGGRCQTFDYVTEFNNALYGENQNTFGNENVIVKDSFTFNVVNTRIRMVYDTSVDVDVQQFLDAENEESLALEHHIITELDAIKSMVTNYSHATFHPPFTRGSLIAVFALTFVQSFRVPADLLLASLGSVRRSNRLNLPGLTLQSYSIQEICPEDLNCLNGGTCVPDDKLNSICICTPDWQGTRCDRPVITMENVVEASTMFAAMTETMAPTFEVTDIETAVAVVQDINDLQVTDTEVTGNVIDIVNNVMNANESVLMEANQIGVTSGLTQSLEQQLIRQELPSNSTYRRRLQNIAAVVADISSLGINIGVASFTVESSTQSSVNESTADDLSDDAVVLLTSNEDIAIDVGDASTYLRLPDNFGERITDQENLRAVFVVYRRPLLFTSRWLQEQNGIGRVFDRSINTRVLSATVSNKGREITYLSGGILQQRFMPLETNGKIFNPVCVFWDFDADGGNGNWSSDGCTYQGRTRNGQILCQCDHLTNFAVLMDIYGHGVINPTEEKILEIMSILGCSISIIGLITTIIVYMTLKSLRRLQPSRILVGLCLSLLGLYICFLFVASFDNDSIPTVTCNILAGLFHFFALNALSWMAVEGLNMYLLFVKVFDTHVHSFMKRAIFVTTVGPLIIVGVTAGATRSNYIRSDLCFLQQWPLIGGVLVPIGVIIITNTVIFVLVFRQLLKSVAGKKSEKRKKQQRLKRARNALSIMTLMGLTWGLGFLSIIYALSGVIQWLFTIINSMQGFTIFLLYCMRNPTVARFFKKRLPCCALETISAATPSSSKAVGSSAQNASNAFTPASVPISSVEERRYASH